MLDLAVLDLHQSIPCPLSERSRILSRREVDVMTLVVDATNWTHNSRSAGTE